MEDFKKRTSVIWSNLSRNKNGYTFSETPNREQTQSCTEGSPSNSNRFWKRGGVKKEDIVDLPISTQALLLDDDTPQQKYRASPTAPFSKSASLSFLKESDKASNRKSTFRDKLGMSPKTKNKVEKSEPIHNAVTQLNPSVATLSFNDSPDTSGKMRMTMDSDPFLLKFVSTDQLRFKGLTAREAASRFPEHKSDSLAFFVPGNIYEEYPAGHWIKPDEYLDDYTNRGINWLELRTRQLACKVYLPELQIQKTMMLNSSWTGAEAFNKIIEKMFKHFSQEQRESNANIYTLKTHTLFIRQSTNEGIWVQENQVLEDFDALNNGGVEIRKKEWILNISLSEIRISDQIQVTIGDFIRDDNADHITISVDPFTTVKEIRRKLVKTILKNEDPDDFLFYFPTNKNTDLTVTLRQSFEKVVKFSHTNTTGVWMVDDLFLSQYYNKYDGYKNNVIILKEVQRPVWFKLPNRDKQKIIVYEHDTVSQVVQAISHRVDLNNKDMFGLKIAREDGSEYSLSSALTLREQGVTDSDVLTLHVKYPLSNVTKISSFDTDVILYYQQVKSIVTSGRYTFPPKLTSSLFALQLQSDLGECTPSLYKSGLLGTLDFPSWALALESDILLQWKKHSSLSREEACGEYIQRLKDFTLEEPPKDLRKGSEVTVKGLSTMDFIKKTKYRLEFDFSNKSVNFFDPENKKALSIQSSQLSHIRLEKNEDAKTLSILNFLDPSIAAEKNIEINFASNVEREYAYLVLNNFRGTANHVNLSIFVATYNLGGAMPNNLEYLISNKHDIVVLGTQECKFEGTVTWLDLVMGTLGTDFQVISDISMWEMSLVIISRKEHVKHITNIETVTKATGIANVVGNKGGVAVSFKFLDTSFCFVCSHLPARAERLLNRNQDYQNLVENLSLGVKKSELQFDYLYWLGDLNYRVDASREVITALIGLKNWDKLMTLDQLTNEKRANRTFCGFKEGKIAFPPTYRYDRGTNEWSKKKLQNVPSYCDRVLWRTLAGVEEPKLISYNWAGELQTSDHRPVYSIFNVDVKLPLENILQPVVRVARIVLYEILILCDIEDNYPVKKNVPSRSGSIAPPQESYLTIRAPFIQDVFQKQVPLTKVVDPWRAKASWTQHLEIIGPFSVLQSCIGSEHLFVQMFVVDDGSFGRASSIGHAVIPLKDFVDATAPKRFEVPIGIRGLYWGTMMGMIDFS